eukprot:764011-Hanusia_phi.AAC.5
MGIRRIKERKRLQGNDDNCSSRRGGDVEGRQGFGVGVGYGELGVWGGRGSSVVSRLQGEWQR